MNVEKRDQRETLLNHFVLHKNKTLYYAETIYEDSIGISGNVVDIEAKLFRRENYGIAYRVIS